METKKKILVIDDDEDLCLLIKDDLEETGKFVVITLTSPINAENVCKKEDPDLILLDIVMPERKGSDVAVALKADPLTQNIPIIIMSGLGELVYQKKEQKWLWLPNRPIVFKRGEVIHERIPERAADAYGVENYIAKPFTTQELLKKIDDIFP